MDRKLIILAVICTILVVQNADGSRIEKRGIFSKLFNMGKGRRSGRGIAKNMIYNKGFNMARRYAARKGGRLGRGLGKALDFYQQRRAGRSGLGALTGYNMYG